MDPRVRHFDEAPGLPDGALKRVRGVAGVQWAVRFFKGQVLARIEKGLPRSVILEAVDDANLVGAPQELIAGNLADLRRPYAVIVDKAGYEYLWPGEPIRLGREFEINDRRAVLVGVCKASPPFVTLPVMFTRFNEALMYVPTKRNLMNFVLAEPMPGENGASARRAHLARDRPAGRHAGGILLEHDQLHARLDGHSGELRHHDRAGVHRRRGRGGADVLPVHTREPEALRLAQGDGGQQSPADRRDSAASPDGRRHRVCPGRRTDGGVFRPHEPDHAPGGTAHALAGGRRRRRRRALIVSLASLLSLRRVLYLEPAIVFRGA